MAVFSRCALACLDGFKGVLLHLNIGQVSRLIAVVAISLAILPAVSLAQATSTEERYFDSAGDAQSACTAEPVQYFCAADGQLYQSGCNAIQAPHGGGGLSRVTRVEMSKPGGMGACYYSGGASFKYTYLIWRDTPCPSGTKFVGPSADDCQNTAYKDYSESNKKGCGGGGGGGNNCDASQQGDSKDARGNPINTLIGNKTQREVDIDSAGSGVPTFVRTYNSFESRNLASLGVGWMHNWARKLQRTGNTIEVIRSDGASQTFTGSGYGFWTGDADTKLRLEAKEASYEVSSQDGTVETYDRMGRLLTVRDARGLVTTLDQSPGLLVSVTGPFGHKLTFGWAAGSLTSVTDAAGNTVYFNVDAYSNLKSATYPDASTRTYLYESFVLRHGLTGIVDGTGTRIATYSYSIGNLVANGTSRAGGVDAQAVSFSVNSMVAYITDSVGRLVTMFRTRVLGINKTIAVTNSTDTKTVSKAYDSQGNLTSYTNEEGQTTLSAYDSANRLVSLTRAAGTSIAHQTQIGYGDTFFSNVVAVAEPSVKVGSVKTTSYGYADSRFPLLPTTATASGFTPAGAPVSRSIGVGYTAHGQVSWIDGPRNDVIDRTTIEYWDCTSSGACGQVRRITNALAQSTTFDSYDGAGRLTQTTSPSGVVTTYAYNARGKVTSITETGGSLTRTMTFAYDAATRMSGSTAPTGRQLTYSYDGASQLVSVSDQAGNSIAYGYDLRGNRIAQTVKDSAGTIATQVGMTFNARSQLESISAAGATLQIGNDGVGNPVAIQDPKGGVTTNYFDALNRMWKSVNSANGATTASFTPSGDISVLTSPNGAVFGFEIDDLGNVLKDQSSDRGARSFTYDGAGNAISRTDVRGVSLNYAFDALRRVKTISYPSGVEDTTYVYDTCGAGLLCQVTDASGTRNYTYDSLGRVSTEVWGAPAALGGHTFTTTYTWTSFDRPASITAPSGRQVVYTYDANGRVLSATSGGQNIVTGRTYRANGLPGGQTFGNGLVETIEYDAAGRPTTWNIGSIETRAYTYDSSGNVATISYGGATRAYNYDSLDRLISEPGQALSWDASGNRIGDATGGYSYHANSNRLASSPRGTIGLDVAGNTVALGNLSFAYSEGGRLAQVSVSGAVVGAYVYRADGLRAAKTAADGATLFHWAIDGTLLEESNSAGTPIRSYGWIDGAPIVQWTGAGPVAPVYLHADHLATPRLATTSAQNVAWRWDGTAFGVGAPTGNLTVNLRFPGQYVDIESGLLQNWHRTYDPGSGRYLESDPIGLEGGFNTYSYVDGNPLIAVDPTGEYGVVGAAIGGLGDLGYQLYRNGGKLKCVNWWEVGAWALTGSGAGIVSRGGFTSIVRFFNDPRKWSKISKEYWTPRGGAGTSSLDHWLITKSFSKRNEISPGVANAGFNLVEMPQVMNSFLGGFVAPGVAKTAGVEAAIEVGRVAATGFVVGTAGLGAVGGFVTGTLAQQDAECGCK